MKFNVLFILFTTIALASVEGQTLPSQRLLNRETSLGGRRDLGWWSNAWKGFIQGIEHVADVTGFDNVVHFFTDGLRLFNTDGSYNNELLQDIVSDTIVAVEDAFEKTGLDELVHKVTGGCRVLNRDATLNNGCAEDLEDLVKDVAIEPFKEKALKVWENMQKGGNIIMDTIKEHVLTAQEADFLGEALNGEVNLDNAAHRQKLGEILENRALEVVEEMRYGIGLVGGKRPVVTFGMGLGCSAAYFVGAGGSLDIFSNIPLYEDQLHDMVVTSSASVGIGAQVGLSCSAPFHFSFNTDPAKMGGFSITVSIEAAKFGGIKVDFIFALDTDSKRFALSTISISASVGAKFAISGAATYTHVLRTLERIPVSPVTDKIQKPAEWCAEEGSVCHCDGIVRYGHGEKWYWAEVESSIGCNNQKFGDPNPGQRKSCTCLPKIYGDGGFHFELRGDEGNEMVTITDGGSTRTRKLSTNWKRFSASNANIVIEFTNDKGSNDVFFRAKTAADIRHGARFPGWKCGTSSENNRCELVRNGGFYWGGSYQIEFKTSMDNIVEENAPGVGGWGGSCTCPDGSVYQVGDNLDYCDSLACIGGVSGTCNRRHGVWSRRKVTCGAQLAPEGLVWMNHIYDNPGFYTCEALPVNDPCVGDGHCVQEKNCPMMDGQPNVNSGLVWMNHIYDNPGFYTCEELPVNDPCVGDGHCVQEKNCPMMDGQPIVDASSVHWVADGCGTNNFGGAFAPNDERHGVRCCSNGGSTCKTTFNCRSGNKLTFQEAEDYCANEGLRVCTKAEIESRVCCGSGGGCDHFSVWTSTESQISR